LGRTLGLAIIAEGIEEQGQLERLRGLGCEFGQGYLFARPETAATVTRYLEIELAQRSAPPATSHDRNSSARDIPATLPGHQAPASV
jgi:predicted signal transduction protein with EAL and GGDEF domain